MDEAGRKEQRRFFNFAAEFADASATARASGPEEARECLRTALLDTVRHHLVSDVPVGVFLSAGLDSSTLSALAKEVGQEDLRTLTLGFQEFQGSENDETVLAGQIARHYGIPHETCWISQNDFRVEYPRLLDAMDQPSIDGVNSYFVCKSASQVGIKVALSGLGGDELFGGYPSFRQIPRMAGLLAPFQAVPWLGRGFRRLSAPSLKHFTSSKYAGLLEYGGTYGGAYLLRRGLFMPWELPGLMGGDMVREGWEELKTLSRLDETTRGLRDPHFKVSALETAWYMRNQLLRDSDWASMAHSLELRLPLVDIGLYRAIAPLFGTPYAPDKLAMAGSPKLPLPAVVMARRKTGFSTPLREWSLGMESFVDGDRGLRGWARCVYSAMVEKNP